MYPSHSLVPSGHLYPSNEEEAWAPRYPIPDPATTGTWVPRVFVSAAPYPSDVLYPSDTLYPSPGSGTWTPRTNIPASASTGRWTPRALPFNPSNILFPSDTLYPVAT